LIRKIFNKLLPPKEQAFFACFIESANICHQLVSVLFEAIHHGLEEKRMLSARSLKHQSNGLTKEILTKLNATFITPIDREDIQRVNLLLNSIAKKISKATLILQTYQLTSYPDMLKRQASVMLEAAEQLDLVVNKFKDFKKITDITANNQRMKEIETRGDEILYHAMLDLFSGKYDPLTVIELRDIYNNIEKALDLCFSVSDEIVNIVLKHV
jgi:uncharacterized protein